jgi:hypothetical protein
MHHHHDAEEKEFFPSIEAISGIEGLMTRNVEQHRAFTPGFEQFEAYCRTCSPADYDGQKLKSLVEGFAEPLTRHLYEEIDTLRALDKYDSVRIRQAYQRFEKSLMATDNASQVLYTSHICETPLMISSNALHRSYSERRTEVSKEAFTIFLLCHSSYLILSIMCSPDDTAERGGSILARCGEIVRSLRTHSETLRGVTI